MKWLLLGRSRFKVPWKILSLTVGGGGRRRGSGAFQYRGEWGRSRKHCSRFVLARPRFDRSPFSSFPSPLFSSFERSFLEETRKRTRSLTAERNYLAGWLGNFPTSAITFPSAGPSIIGGRDIMQNIPISLDPRPKEFDIWRTESNGAECM